MPLNTKEISEFRFGIIDDLEQQSIPRGAASRSLNWLTKLTHVELRRGYVLLGVRNTNNDPITGLYVGKSANGTDIPLRTYNRKLEYFDPTDKVWREVSTNLIPQLAAGDEMSFASYQNLAGHWVFMSNTNGDFWKLSMNPKIGVGAIAENANMNSVYRYKGKIAALQGRIGIWDTRDNLNRNDKSGFYLSYIDRDEIGDYTESTGFSVGTGDGTIKAFTNTLTLTGAQTAFGVQITDGTETFYDDGSGKLVGNLGGTGSVNYITGYLEVTFNTAPANLQAITARYYRDAASSASAADFSHSSPRTAGQGAFFNQNEGGNLQLAALYDDLIYCFHQFKTYVLNITNTDTSASNLPFREKLGIPNWRSAVPTEDGIYLINNVDGDRPRFQILKVASNSTEVVPETISGNLNLTDYRFDKSYVRRWGDYVIFGCRHKDSSYNNRMFLYHRRYGTFDLLDYVTMDVSDRNGELIAGDPLTSNAFTLFSGIDDDGATIQNYWEGNLDKLDSERLKKTKKLILQGQIGALQKIKVSVSVDRGAFVEIGNSTKDGIHIYAIQGDGTYVDKTQAVNVGSLTLGRGEVGGGGTGITAYNFYREISLNQDKFQEIKLRFEAMDVGWASISYLQWKDIRYKEQKLPVKYR